MHINIILTEYFVYICSRTAKLIGKPCYSMPLLSKPLFNNLPYVNHHIAKVNFLLHTFEIYKSNV